MKPCGTEAAYQRHLYHGEEPCPEDRLAAAAAARERNRAKGARALVPAKHGTRSKYSAGCRCAFCRDAAAAYERSRRAGNPRSPIRREKKAWKLREDVLDRLEMDGWVTADMLAMEGGHNVEAVERVLRGLRDGGLVESKTLKLAYGRNRNGFETRTEWRLHEA